MPGNQLVVNNSPRVIIVLCSYITVSFIVLVLHLLLSYLYVLLQLQPFFRHFMLAIISSKNVG